VLHFVETSKVDGFRKMIYSTGVSRKSKAITIEAVFVSKNSVFFDEISFQLFFFKIFKILLFHFKLMLHETAFLMCTPKSKLSMWCRDIQ
jgi:hypothetical protein